VLEGEALKTGDFELLQPLVWLVDDRTPEVQKAALLLLARCILKGVSSGQALTTQGAAPALFVGEGQKKNDDNTSTKKAWPEVHEGTNEGAAATGGGRAQSAPTRERTEGLLCMWREGYQLGIARLVPEILHRDPEIRRHVAGALRAVVAAGDKEATKQLRKLLSDRSLLAASRNSLLGGPLQATQARATSPPGLLAYVC
jgi:hypothetical protein